MEDRFETGGAGAARLGVAVAPMERRVSVVATFVDNRTHRDGVKE
ncbi:hypothetical protein [Mycolicibacterium doricum]|nr:hypothetical protein [Mycolicibacterium doricum]